MTRHHIASSRPTWLLAALMLGVTGPAAARASATPTQDQTLIARGQYLARLGGCASCHTQPGGQPFAGGRAIVTPFGTFHTPNITPDKTTGIGTWTFATFYRAMHEGIGADGQYLYPAFPFPAYTRLRKDDVEAIWAYLRTLAPVTEANRGHDLHWPYRVRSLAMSVWRRLYFEPGTYQTDAQKSAAWNRGAYLVRGLAHCATCHTPRNKLGATLNRYALGGGSIKIDGWYPPNVTSNPYAGIGSWSDATLKAFLTTGRSDRGDALGPMRDVVRDGLQHLHNGDANAIVAYLKSVPAQGPSAPPRTVSARAGLPGGSAAAREEAARTGARIKLPQPSELFSTTPPGETLYHKHCSDCHGDDGKPKHEHYPSLVANHVVTAPNPNNLLLMILRGGFQASTDAYPYPYSMPPFGFRLSDKEVAAIANYVRNAWGDAPLPTVWPKQVAKLR